VAGAEARSPLRAVALPTEHGGWGLTAEPALLGLLVSPSVAGVALGLGALVAFLARTPLRVVLVDRWRGRDLDRTRLARRVLASSWSRSRRSSRSPRRPPPGRGGGGPR
jgi:hypothetical protein